MSHLAHFDPEAPGFVFIPALEKTITRDEAITLGCNIQEVVPPHDLTKRFTNYAVRGANKPEKCRTVDGRVIFTAEALYRKLFVYPPGFKHPAGVPLPQSALSPLPSGPKINDRPPY